MPPRPVPIPNSLWARLAALDATCCIHMWREGQWLTQAYNGPSWSGIGEGKPQRRAWRVRIHPHGEYLTRDIIDAAEVALKDALERAVISAERRGWSTPPRPDPAATSPRG